MSEYDSTNPSLGQENNQSYNQNYNPGNNQNYIPNYNTNYTSQNIPARNVQYQNAQYQDMPIQNAQYQGMPMQNVQYQGMPMQNVQYQGMPTQYQSGYPQYPGNEAAQAAEMRKAGNPEVCEHVRKVISSNMGFAAAIISACPVLLMIMSLITGIEPWLAIVCMIPLVFAPIEAWVTFGTAKWGKGKVMRGGIILGKVMSVLQIVFSGIEIAGYLMCAILYAVSASFVGNFYDELVEGLLQALELDMDVDLVSKMASYSTGIVFLMFIILMIPYILNIVLNVFLNNFRNGVIDAIDGFLNKFQKTMALAVLIFLVGLPILALAVLLLVALSGEEICYIFMALAYVVAAALYFYSGALIIVFGKGK